MDLSDLLARENAHVQAKEAEALTIMAAHAGPAWEMLDGAKREFGGVLQTRDLGAFISPAAGEMYKKGKREATRFLFDAYATTVFPLVSNAEAFIALLDAINARVEAKLSVIDGHEAELCMLEWVRRAWEREKPTIIQRDWRRLRAFWKRSSQIHDRPEPDPGVIEEGDASTAAVTEAAMVIPVGRATANGVDGTPEPDAGEVAQVAPQSPSIFRERSSWLDDCLLRRGWSTSDPYKWGGPDRKTIEKILRGEAVTNSVLLKLADALSKKGGTVNVTDIPKT